MLRNHIVEKVLIQVSRKLILWEGEGGIRIMSLSHPHLGRGVGCRDAQNRVSRYTLWVY